MNREKVFIILPNVFSLTVKGVTGSRNDTFFGKMALPKLFLGRVSFSAGPKLVENELI